MSIQQFQVTVATTRTLLWDGRNSTYGTSILAQNNSASDIRVGDSTVTTTSGLIIPAGWGFNVDGVGPADALYAVSLSNAAVIDMLVQDGQGAQAGGGVDVVDGTAVDTIHTIATPGPRGPAGRTAGGVTSVNGETPNNSGSITLTPADIGVPITVTDF